VGATPVADALARLARSMDYRITRVVDAREQADVEAAGIGAPVNIRTAWPLATSPAKPAPTRLPRSTARAD